MYKVTVLLILGLTLAGFQASTFKSTDEMEIDRQEIVTLETEAARATQLSNATFIKRVFSEEYSGTTASGQVVNKAQLTEIVQFSSVKYSSILAKDVFVRLYDDTAVVTSRWEKRGVANGRIFVTNVRVLHVFLNGSRGWKIIAGQETNTQPN